MLSIVPNLEILIFQKIRHHIRVTPDDIETEGSSSTFSDYEDDDEGQSEGFDYISSGDGLINNIDDDHKDDKVQLYIDSDFMNLNEDKKTLTVNERKNIDSDDFYTDITVEDIIDSQYPEEIPLVPKTKVDSFPTTSVASVDSTATENNVYHEDLYPQSTINYVRSGFPNQHHYGKEKFEKKLLELEIFNFLI